MQLNFFKDQDSSLSPKTRSAPGSHNIGHGIFRNSRVDPNELKLVYNCSGRPNKIMLASKFEIESRPAPNGRQS
jgi:hypothetical protein